MNISSRSHRARQAGITGRHGETIAILWLALKGYRPLARRYGGKGGEIDLIVKRGRTIAFVEVKARATIAAAAEAITAEKQRLITLQLRHWLARNPWAMDHHWRADAVFLAPWRWPSHIAGVFELPL